MPFIPTRLRLNEATISANDEDRPGINSLEEEKKTKSNFNFFVVVIIGFLMFTYCAQHEYNQIVKKRSNLFIEDKTKQKKKETSTLRCRRIIRNDSICSLAIDFPLTR